MLALLRELFVLARKEGLTLYRYRREHPDKFHADLVARRLTVKGRLRRKWLDNRISRWKTRAESKARNSDPRVR